MQQPARFQRAAIFPPDWNDAVSDFLDLFQFHRYQYIYRAHESPSWLSAKEDWRLTDTEILKAIAAAHPKYLLGFRFGKQTRFAVIDIDSKSPYRNLRSFNKLKRVLSAAGINHVVPFRSSESDGWHLYIFFDEYVSSTHLRRALVDLLTYTGFRIKSGELEIFPNTSQTSAGMGLRLPLQPGFAFLNEKTMEPSIERWELSPTKALDYFLDEISNSSNTFANFRQLQKRAQECAQSLEKLTLLRTERTSTAKVVMLPRLSPPTTGEHIQSVSQIFSFLPPGIRTDDWFRGRGYHEQGLTGPSQRADAIYCLSHYFFYGDPSRSLPALGYGYETERELAIKQIIELRHNGFSNDLNKGDKDALSQIERAANWIPPQRRSEESKKYTAIQPISWVRENANRKTDARRRIQSALEKLQNRGTTFTTVEMQALAECSRTTLYKHEDIWRQAYEDLAEDFFASCTHEYNGVVGGGSPKTTPLPLPDKKEVTPGLLAARRVVYELMMRDARRQKVQQKLKRENVSNYELRWNGEFSWISERLQTDLCVKELKFLIALLLALLQRAPNEDSEQLVRLVLKELNDRIQQEVFHQVLDFTSSNEIPSVRRRSDHQEI